MSNKMNIVTRKYITIFLIAVLGLTLFFNTYNTKALELNKEVANTLGNGAWMHVDTFANASDEDIDTFAETLNLSGLDFVIILAKDIDGSVTFPSKYAKKVRFSFDHMGRIINILTKKGIKVYLYFVINTDQAWIKENPADNAYQCGSKEDKKPIQTLQKNLVNLTSSAYLNYVISIIKEAIQKYKISGIQLDYIRYSNGYYGFSPIEISEAKKRGINIDKIIDYTYKTFVSPGDWRTILLYYDDQDKDVLQWAKLREDIIYNFAFSISKIVKTLNQEFGISLVSSGAFDGKYKDNGSESKAYSAIHFGQSYERLSAISDFATPMAYHGNRENPFAFVKSVLEGAIKKVNKNCKISLGIQANSTNTESMINAIKPLKDKSIGCVLFRIGTFCMANYDFIPIKNNKTKLLFSIYNGIEGGKVKGVEFNEYANIFALDESEYSKFAKWDNKNNHIKFYSDLLLNPLKSSEYNLILTTDLGKINNYFDPYFVCSNEKNNFPTFSNSIFAINFFKISSTNKTINKNKIEPININIEINNAITFIDFESIKRILGEDLTYDLGQSYFTLFLGSKSIKYSFSKNYNEYKIGDKSFNLNTNYSIYMKNNILYIPLKATLEFFGYSIFYNSTTKEIYCLKFSYNKQSAAFINLSDKLDVLLLFSSAENIYVNYFDLIGKQYFDFILNLHLKGKLISVICDLSKRDVKYFEQVFNLINFNESEILKIDSIVFYINSENCFSEKLKDKELFFNSNAIIDKKILNKEKVNILLEKDAIITEDILIYKCYLKKVYMNLTQCKNYCKLSINQYFLFLSQNFQF
jgi:hypothetical protein